LNEKHFSLPHVPFELLQGALRKFTKSHNKRPGTGFLQMCHQTHTQCSLIVICVWIFHVFSYHWCWNHRNL